MRHAIRQTFVALSLTACSAVYAATTVPFIFTQGTPAKASEVNADFQALADAIDAQQLLIDAQKLLIDAQKLRMDAQDTTIAALTAVQPDKIVSLINRVDKLDGTTPVTMDDLVGTYDLQAFRIEVPGTAPQDLGFVAVTGTATMTTTKTINPDGSVTTSCNGTVTVTNNATTYTCPAGAGCSNVQTPFAYTQTAPFTCSLSGGKVTTSLSTEPVSVLAGGHMLVGSDHFPGILSGTNKNAMGTVLTVLIKK